MHVRDINMEPFLEVFRCWSENEDAMFPIAGFVSAEGRSHTERQTRTQAFKYLRSAIAFVLSFVCLFVCFCFLFVCLFWWFVVVEDVVDDIVVVWKNAREREERVKDKNKKDKEGER